MPNKSQRSCVSDSLHRVAAMMDCTRKRITSDHTYIFSGYRYISLTKESRGRHHKFHLLVCYMLSPHRYVHITHDNFSYGRCREILQSDQTKGYNLYRYLVLANLVIMQKFNVNCPVFPTSIYNYFRSFQQHMLHVCEWRELTHWGRVTHICVSKQTIIRSDNDLSSGRRQAIIWTNAWILIIGTLGTNFSEILIEIRIFSFKKMGLKVSPAKMRPFCFGLNELTNHQPQNDEFSVHAE